jgi:hypothetical protein
MQIAVTMINESQYTHSTVPKASKLLHTAKVHTWHSYSVEGMHILISTQACTKAHTETVSILSLHASYGLVLLKFYAHHLLSPTPRQHHSY